MSGLRRRVALLLLGGSVPKAMRALAEGMETADLLEAIGQSGLIPEDLVSLVKELGEFRDIIVREIMVPRTKMVCVAEDTTVKEVVRYSVDQEFSHYPVYRDAVDNIVGILHAKDLLPFGIGEEVSIAKIMRPPYFVPETKRTIELLRELQLSKNHLAIVLDEYGGVSGLITMEDLIEQVFGEIQDEFDEGETKPVVPTSDGGWEVSGGLEIRELEELLAIEIGRRGFDTVAGLIHEQLGRVPTSGDRVEFGGYSFQVLGLEGHRILRVKITPLPKDEPAAGEAP